MGIQTSTINSGPVSGFKNKIINGNFDFWQRGTSLTASAATRYLADRWVTGSLGTTNAPSMQTFTLGQTDVPNNPTQWQRTVVASVAGTANYCALQQRIEFVTTLSGQQVTASFWAKADTTRSIAVSFDQVFGSGGSPSGNVLGNGTKYTVTTSWQKITFTTTIPSVSGKTLGSNADSGLYFNIWFDAGSDYNARTGSLGQQSGTFDIAQVQVEQGPVATTFESRDAGTEFAMCQRYFQVVGNASGNFCGITGSSSIYTSIPVRFAVEMRTNPGVTFTSQPSGTYVGSSNSAEFRLDAAQATIVGAMRALVSAEL